ncbi:hypothetical protein EDB89DRAFT_1984660 [Lactarius sanguifluus]|nr:hypothetical protein EDB89DRAFT_1984660 [Lactarius sanguifluus]
MSTVTTESSKKAQSKPKTKEKRQGQIKANGTERLKTIVRRLPPNLPEHIFWQSVQPWVTDDTVLWKEFYPGKSRKRQNKEDVHSRAYIAFKTEGYVAKFRNESQVVVEFAPYQKLPLEKKKVDSRNATIDQVASTERPSMPASTPLLDALKAEKSAQRDKEAIQRNHPHYKDAAQASKKEESKKKTAAAASTAATAKQSSDSAAPLGKRAAKRAAAAAAQKASAQTSAPTLPKAGIAPAASTTKPPPSPNKSKSTRASKHHASAQAQSSKLSSAPLDPATQVAAASNTPAETGAGASAPAPAPAAAAGSNETGRRTRPVLGLASRQFEVALSGAGVSKGSRRDRGAEKEKEPAKDGPPPREKKDGGSRKNKEEDAPARNPVLVPQPGVLPAPTILQREAKPPPPPRQSQQAPSDASAATPSGRSGKRGRGRGRGGNNRGAPPPPADS